MSISFTINECKKIKGVWIIRPSISRDHRGTIWTSFLENEIETLLPRNLHFKHDKFSESKYNVLRGIHGDEKSWKLVTCVYGEIIQVVVDCRKESPTYMKWEKFIINSLKISIITTLIVTSVASLAGYAFSRFKFKGASVMLILFLITQMFPGPSILIPIYRLIDRLGLLDTHTAIVLVDITLTLPFAIWLAIGSFENIPIDIEEAAYNGGYCVGSGNSVPEYIKFENYLAMLDAAKEFGRLT